MATLTENTHPRIVIFIPCETFRVKVTLGPSDVPTPLERLVLKAIHAGAISLGLLGTLFLLGRRPTLRLLLDLLNRGYIAVNFENGEVRLTGETAGLVANNLFEQLKSGERIEQEMLLMRDLVTGCVLPLRTQPRATSGSRVSALLPPRTASGLSLDQVNRVVRRELLSKKTQAGRPLRVLESSLGPNDGGGQTRDLELEVKASFDENSDVLQLTVEAPDNLPWDVRRRIERKLTQLANEESPQIVFKNMRAKAVRDSHTVIDRSVASQFAALDVEIEQLASVPRGTEQTWQDKLFSAAQRLEGDLQFQSPHVSHELITFSADHVDAISELIRGAERQVVLACPFIGYDALALYRSNIERALGLGRRVFMLLGMDDTFRLPTGVRSVLDKWQVAYPDRFFFSERAARCHAKFVVVDGRSLLITSYNFLNAVPGPTFELGIQIKAFSASSEMAAACEQAIQLLSLAQEIIPDPIYRELLSTNPESVASAPVHRGLRAIPSVSFDESSWAKETTHRIQFWRLRWQQYRTGMARAIASLHTTFRIVRDAEHRQLLYEALRSARFRLLIVSDQLSDRVVTRPFLKALNECLSRHVSVILIARRPDARVLNTLRQVAATSDHLKVLASDDLSKRLDLHAKLLVCDEWAVVTSYNFLSFSGDYEGPERFRMRTELGVLLEGIPAVESLLSTIAVALPSVARLAGLVPRRDLELPDDAVIEIDARDIEALFQEVLSTRARPFDASLVPLERAESRLIGAWFAEAASAASAFAELEQLLLVEAPFIEKAIAACLSFWSEEDDALSERWIERLLERMWWRRRDPSMTFALLLSVGAGSRPAVPPTEIAQLAALCREDCARVEDFDAAALFASESADGDAAAAVWALALHPVLYSIDPPIDALQIVSETLESPFRTLTEAAITFRSQYAAGLAGVSFDAVATTEMRESRAEEARKALCNELQRCLVVKPDLRITGAVWSHLLGGETGLERMHQAASTGNLTIVRELLAAYTRKGVECMIDEAVEEGGRRLPPALREFFGDRRRWAAVHLHRVIAQAKAWTTQASTSDGRIVAPEEIVAFATTVVRERESLIEAFGARASQGRYPSPLLDDVGTRILNVVTLA